MCNQRKCRARTRRTLRSKARCQDYSDNPVASSASFPHLRDSCYLVQRKRIILIDSRRLLRSRIIYVAFPLWHEVAGKGRIELFNDAKLKLALSQEDILVAQQR